MTSVFLPVPRGLLVTSLLFAGFCAELGCGASRPVAAPAADAPGARARVPAAAVGSGPAAGPRAPSAPLVPLDGAASGVVAGSPPLGPGTDTQGAAPSSSTSVARLLAVGAEPRTGHCAKSPPDPAPVESKQWVELQLAYQAGELHLLKAQSKEVRQARSTPRRMGRFAAELWIGCELIERLRFELPLLATSKTKETPKNSPNFEAGLRAAVTLSLPRSERATRLVLVDRVRGTQLELDWVDISKKLEPATPTPAASAASAPAAPASGEPKPDR